MSCLKPGGDSARHCRRTEVRCVFAGIGSTECSGWPSRPHKSCGKNYGVSTYAARKLRDQSGAEVRRKWVGRQEKNKREEQGNSCGKRELWNNLAAPRSLTSLEFSRPGNRFGISCLRRLEVTSCRAAMRPTEPAGSSERSAGGRVNQTGLAG